MIIQGVNNQLPLSQNGWSWVSSFYVRILSLIAVVWKVVIRTVVENNGGLCLMQLMCFFFDELRLCITKNESKTVNTSSSELTHRCVKLTRS